MGISEISDDLLSLILVRLPIECIGQSKCVSKPWNALISSQKFIESHLIQSRILQNPNVLIPEIDTIIQMRGTDDAFYQPAGNLVKMIEFSFTRGESDHIDLWYKDFDYKSKRFYSLPELLDERFIVQIVGSSNGLLCLLVSVVHVTICSLDTHDSCRFSDFYSFLLCNPWTKSTWELPGNQWKCRFSDESLYGFWYDDVNDDYKVVVLNRIREKDGILVYECEVYSLKSDSWSKVTSYLEDFTCDFKVAKYEDDGVLFNNALHWILLGDHLYSSTKLILALDLATYKLKILPFPFVTEAYYRLKLTVLDGSLVLSDGDSGELYNLWMMKKDSWSKITVIKSFGGCSLTPLALLEDKYKRLILVSFDDYGEMFQMNDLVSYQYLTFGMPWDFRNARQHQFVGSLVQPYPPSVGFEKILSEDGLKDFEKFRIYINGVSIDSQLSEHVQRKYYDLCCSRKSFLHERLVPGIRSEVAVRMIMEVVNIVDYVRSCRLTTSKEEIEKWGTTARSLELLGMNVGFLRDRIRCLLSLAFDSEEGIEAKKYWEVKSKRAQIKYEIDDLKKKLEDLEKKLVERGQACEKYGDEADALKPKAKSYKLMFQEQANAPW